MDRNETKKFFTIWSYFWPYHLVGFLAILTRHQKSLLEISLKTKFGVALSKYEIRYVFAIFFIQESTLGKGWETESTFFCFLNAVMSMTKKSRVALK